MTAELCDCYSTKAEGVNSVLDSVLEGLPDQPVFVWGIDERFHNVDEIRRSPALAAAANWLALAIAAARQVPQERGLLIDIGSTTTDLIPLHQGRVAAIGRSDTDRLHTGELVYAGVRRTPICALATELPFRGQSYGLAAELFATTLDVFLTRGDLASDPADLGTADGRPATIEAARDRLARMVCADREGFADEDAFSLVLAAEQCLVDRLCTAARRVCQATIGNPSAAIISGSGEFLSRRVAQRAFGPDLPITSLTDAWGASASQAACAHALIMLVMAELSDVDAQSK
jgi:probable H4MPT-linked C1 transfer pathway protein